MTSPERGAMHFERELGRARRHRDGATLIVVAGIHGNEHGGAVALQRVFEQLAIRSISFARSGSAATATRTAAARSPGRRWATSHGSRPVFVGFAIAKSNGVSPEEAMGLVARFPLGNIILGRAARMAAGDYEASFELSMARKDVALMIDAAKGAPLASRARDRIGAKTR